MPPYVLYLLTAAPHAAIGSRYNRGSRYVQLYQSQRERLMCCSCVFISDGHEI